MYVSCNLSDLGAMYNCYVKTKITPKGNRLACPPIDITYYIIQRFIR